MFVGNELRYMGAQDAGIDRALTWTALNLADLIWSSAIRHPVYQA